MKTKDIYGIIAIVAVLTAILAQGAFSLENPIIKATLLRYEPTPAQPGGYMTVYAQIENIGGRQADNVRIEFKESYPFSVDDPNEAAEVINTLGIGQTFITDFKIRVDENAVAGANDLKFTITVGSLAGAATEKIFSVNVQELSTDLSIEGIAVSPPELNPGERGLIEIVLKNNEDTTLTHISSNLLTYAISGATVVDAPFAIEDSVSKKTISVLKSGEEQTLEYSIRSYPDIEPGIYKIPLALEFFDSTGANFSKTEFVTILINPAVDSYITIESTDLSSQKSTGTVTFKLVNKGFGEIKFANLKLLSSSDYELLTPYDQVYIGTIDSDDYSTADFNIKVMKNDITIPVEVSFKDSLNNEHVLKEDLPLNLNLQNQATKSSGGFIWTILIVVVIGGAGYWIYRRRKRR